MKFRTLGDSDLKVSVIGLGTWAMGNDFFGSVDDQQSIEAIHAALDNGVNLVDTAPAYGSGHSEEVVGKAIAGRREAVVLATKVGTFRRGRDYVTDLSRASIRRQIEESLRRLNVDMIDLYQIHWPDPKTPLEESIEELSLLQKAGKFRYLGVSNFSIGQMDIVRRLASLISLQPHYSLLRREIEKNELPYCRRHGIGVLGYGTLAGGILTGKFREIPKLSEGDTRDRFYDFFREPVWTRIQKLLDLLRAIADERSLPVAHISAAWALQQPGITSSLAGAKNAAQARSNAAVGDLELSSAELDRIGRGLAEFSAAST